VRLKKNTVVLYFYEIKYFAKILNYFFTIFEAYFNIIENVAGMF